MGFLLRIIFCFCFLNLLSAENVNPINQKINIKHESKRFCELLYSHLMAIATQVPNASEPLQCINCPSIDELEAGDIIYLGNSRDDIHTLGVYLGNHEFLHMNPGEDSTDLEISDIANWLNKDDFPYQVVQSHQIDELTTTPTTQQNGQIPFFLKENFKCYFVTAEQMPLVISPKDPDLSLEDFRNWAMEHQHELISYLDNEGPILMRDFPIASAEDFKDTVITIIGKEPIDYLGEGSRNRVTKGVYTSTKAPPQFGIPLHIELSCTDNPASYFCFYCETAPNSGTGQTIIGSTEKITQAMQMHPNVWNLYSGKNLRYISRHPPEGSIFSKINVTHKSWPEAFHTQDREEVERICKSKGFEFEWHGDWIEVIRIAPAFRGPDQHFDHAYWYNQSYLYHGNPRIRKGWVNHLFVNLLYSNPTTRQYDIEFEDGSPIPRDVVYEIYDVLEENSVKFDWHKGDIMLLNNIKTMHGRAPSKGDRRILVSLFQ